MSILGRYLLSRTLGATALCLGAAALLFLVVDLVGLSRHLSRAAGGGNGLELALTLAWLKLPGVIYRGAPLAALLGALTTCALLHRRGELQAIRGAGMRPWRIALPFALAGGIAGAADLALGEIWLPEATRRLDAFMTGTLKRYNLAWTLFHRRPSWIRSDQTLVHLGRRQAGGGFASATLYEMGPGFSLRRRIDADRVHREGEGYRLEGVVERAFDSSGLAQLKRYDSLAMPVALPAESFDLAGGWPEEMNFAELAELISRREEHGQPTFGYRLGLHRKAALPLACALAALLAAALALAWPVAGAGGGVAGALGRGGVVAFVWWLSGAVAEGVLPIAALAAWLPDLLLLGAAVALLSWRRSR